MGGACLTSKPSDVQDVSDDVLAGASCWLLPGQLQAAGAEGRDLEALRGLREIRSWAKGQAGAGLVGARAVLRDALVDGLVLRADVGDGECPVGGNGGGAGR